MTAMVALAGRAGRASWPWRWRRPCGLRRWAGRELRVVVMDPWSDATLNATATPAENLLGSSGRRGRRREREQPAGVAAEHLLLIVRRKVPEGGAEGGQRRRELGGVVGEVGLHHDLVHPDLLQAAGAVVVPDEAAEYLLLEHLPGRALGSVPAPGEGGADGVHAVVQDPPLLLGQRLPDIGGVDPPRPRPGVAQAVGRAQHGGDPPDAT